MTIYTEGEPPKIFGIHRRSQIHSLNLIHSSQNICAYEQTWQTWQPLSAILPLTLFAQLYYMDLWGKECISIDPLILNAMWYLF